MATITDGDPTTFDAGETPTAAEANAKVALLKETAGDLDMDNLVSGFKFRQHHIQRGVFTRNRSSGANANVDFIGDLLFPNFDAFSTFTFDTEAYLGTDEVTFGVDDVPYLTVPGLAEVMENPYDAASRVRITWRVSMFLGTNNTYADDLLSQTGEKRWTSAGSINVDPIGTGTRALLPYMTSGLLRLFVNGVPHPYLFRRVRGAMSTGVPSTNHQTSEAQNVAGYSDFQVWEFSAVFDTTAVAAWTDLTRSPLSYGTHTVSIRCFHTNRNIRFKTRYIDWTYTK